MSNKKVFCYCIIAIFALLYVVTLTTTSDCSRWFECYEMCSELQNGNKSNCGNADEFCKFRRTPCFIGVSITTISYVGVIFFLLYIFCNDVILVKEVNVVDTV